MARRSPRLACSILRKPQPHVAIGSLSIGGNVTASQILAGYDLGGAARNADASIGKVLAVGSNWIASNLVAGDGCRGGRIFRYPRRHASDPRRKSHRRKDRFRPVIKGTAAGPTEGGDDHFGFVAEQIDAFKVAESSDTRFLRVLEMISRRWSSVPLVISNCARWRERICSTYAG